MPPNKPHGGNNRGDPQTVGASSSSSIVSPVVRNGVNEIVTRLSGIDDCIRDISAECSPNTTNIPDIEELARDISKLQDEVKGVKLAQDEEIKGIHEEVINNVKKDITKGLEGEIGAMIADSIADEVEKEMADWGNKSGVPNFVKALKDMVETNNVLLEDGKILRGNSWSRHANSTIEIQDDLNTPLKQIKRRDGSVSQLFPATVGRLFTYDAAQLIRLLEEYHLRPLEKHNENLNRFLIFIGVNASVPDQLVDPVDEQPPAYLPGDTSGSQDERTQKSTRRRSSASDKSSNALWHSIFG